MNADSEGLQFRDFLEESFDFKDTTWRIRNALSVQGPVGFFVQSPSFSFAYATWELRMYPYGQNQESRGYVDLGIKRLNSQIPEHYISYKVFFKTRHQQEFKSFSGGELFTEDSDEWIVQRYLHRSRLHEMKNQIVVNGVLTVLCQIRTKKFAGIDRSSQIELNTSLPSEYVSDRKKETTGIDNYSQTESNTSLPREYVSDRKKETTGIDSYSQTESNTSLPSEYVSDRKKETTGIDSYSQTESNTSLPSEYVSDRKKETTGIDSYSQTESNTSLSDSNQTVESKVSLHLHDNKILSDLKKLFLKQEDCDVIIRVKGIEFPTHKLILKARSPVFASTFRNDMKERSTGIIDIYDCDPNTFSDFLSFLYTGEVENLSVENVFSLFKTSDKYDIEDLRRTCLELIKENLSVDTFCDTISLAVLHSETELLKLSTDFFAKNLQDIIVTVKWQVFLAENSTIGNELFIKTFVSSKSLK